MAPLDVFVINLDTDFDKWIRMKESLAEMLPEANIRRFSAIKHRVGSFGCAQSHKQILKIAKKEKLDKVLVFEDDVRFIFEFKKTHKVLKRAFDWIENNQWDLLYLGLNIKNNEVKKFKPLHTDCKNILSGEGLTWWGEFAILYNKSSYSVYDKVPDDPSIFKPTHRGDYLLDIQQKLKRYIIRPCLIDHDNMYSYTHSSNGKPIFREQNKNLTIMKKYKIAKLI